MKYKHTVKKCLSATLLISFFCGFGQCLFGGTEEGKALANVREISNEKLSDSKFLLSLKPGCYNLKKNPEGKISSVILIVESDNDGKNKHLLGEEVLEEEARLAAMGMLAELINPPVVTVETARTIDGKETRVTKTTTTTKIVGYSFNLIAQGMDAKQEKQIFVFLCEGNGSSEQ